MNLFQPSSWFNSAPSTNGRAPGAAAPVLPSRPPLGPGRGVVDYLRRWFGGYPGPAASRGTMEEQERDGDKVRRGPENVVLPWFAPYWDNYSDETEEIRRAYRKMPSSPPVKAALLSKIYSVSALRLRIHPASHKPSKRDDVGRPKPPEVFEADLRRWRADKDIAEFVEWNLTRRVAGGLPRLIETILYAGLMDGYSLNAKVWAPEATGKHAGRVVLDALKGIDVQYDAVPQTDDRREVVDVMGLRYNAGRHFAPSDFVHFNHLPLFESPIGTSDFRAIYGSWWMLDTVLKFRAIFSERRATPFFHATYKADSTQQGIMSQLATLKRLGYVATPDSVTLQVLDAAGKAGGEFKSFCDDLIELIFMGLCGATLQSLTGGAGEERGSSAIQASTAGRFNWRLSEYVVGLLNDLKRGLIKDMVDLNYLVGEYPHASLDLVDPTEQKDELAIDAGLQALGFVLSKSEAEERYGRKFADDPEDVLTAAGAPGGMPGGSPVGPGGGLGGQPPGAPPSPDGTPPQPPAKPGGAPEEMDEGEGVIPFAEDDPNEKADLIAGVLYGLFGAAALGWILKSAEAFAEWDALAHPRGKDGRFIPRGSAEAVAAAKAAVGKVLKGEKSGASAEDVAAHLNILTVKQLRELHKEHGKPIPGSLRAELVEAVKARMGATEEKHAKGGKGPSAETHLPASGPEPGTDRPGEKPAPFKPAADHAAAHDFARSLGVRLVGAETTTPLSLANTVNAALARAHAAGAPLPKEAVLLSRHQSFIDPESGEARGAAAYDPKTGALYVNTGGPAVKDPEHFAKIGAALPTYSTAKSLEDVLTHELGHAAHDAGGKGSMRALGAAHGFGHDVGFKPNVAKKVSDYAASSPTEFVAEAFTGLSRGEKYPGDVMDLYRAMGGPEPGTDRPGEKPAEPVQAVADAVKASAGPHNLASLVHVRQHLAEAGMTDRAEQDAAIQAARKAGVVGGSALEGRHGNTPEEIAAAHGKGDERIGFLSARRPEGFAEDAQGHEHKGKGPGGGQFTGKGPGGGQFTGGGGQGVKGGANPSTVGKTLEGKPAELLDKIMSGAVHNNSTISNCFPGVPGAERGAWMADIARHLGMPALSGTRTEQLRMIQSHLASQGLAPAHPGERLVGELIPKLLSVGAGDMDAERKRNLSNHLRNVVPQLTREQIGRVREAIGLTGESPDPANELANFVQSRRDTQEARNREAAKRRTNEGREAREREERERSLKAERPELERQEREAPARAEQAAWDRWLTDKRAAERRLADLKAQKPQLQREERLAPERAEQAAWDEWDRERRRAEQLEQIKDVKLADLNDDDVKTLTGVPFNAKVKKSALKKWKAVYSDDVQLNADGVDVEITHPKLDSCKEFIGVDSEGKKFIQIRLMEVKKEHQGEGIGTQIIAGQIEAASKAGFDYVQLHAAGDASSEMNGYYTWPRLGWDQAVPTPPSRIGRSIRSEFPDAKTILDVMATKKGRDWWKKNGTDLFDARFDLHDGSRSRQILDGYLAERGMKPKAAAAKFGEGGRGLPHPQLDLAPWEEEALERAEAKRDAKQPGGESFSEDASGHEHKGKGPGGGQFTGKGDGSYEGVVHHGSPQHTLSVVSAAPPNRQFDNATSVFGAFFAPDEAGAKKYAGDEGKLYKVKLKLHKPYDMPWKEFAYYQDPTKDAEGKSLQPVQWEGRIEELKAEALSKRKELEAAGHDGMIVKKPRSGELFEIASFKDVPLEEPEKHAVPVAKRAKRDAKRPGGESFSESEFAGLCERFDEEFERLHPRGHGGEFAHGPEGMERRAALHSHHEALKAKYTDPALAAHQKRALRQRIDLAKAALAKAGGPPPERPKTQLEQVDEMLAGAKARLEQAVGGPGESHARRAVQDLEGLRAMMAGEPPPEKAAPAPKEAPEPVHEPEKPPEPAPSAPSAAPAGKPVDAAQLDRDESGYRIALAQSKANLAAHPNSAGYERMNIREAEAKIAEIREKRKALAGSARRGAGEKPAEATPAPESTADPSAVETSQPVVGPALFGSADMVRVATPLRDRKIQEAAAAFHKATADLEAKGKPETARQVRESFSRLLGNRDARHWLDRRQVSGADMLREVWKERYGGFAETWEAFAEDAEGHEHKGKGPGGGQFTGTGQDGNRGQEREEEKSGGNVPTSNRREGKGVAPEPDADRSKFIGQKVGAAEHAKADAVSHEIAALVGGKTEEETEDAGQRDKKPYDVKVDHSDAIEVKSLLKGSKQSLSVHPDALLRKVDYLAAHPGERFHTVAVDERATYEGGAHAGSHSGNRLYYKRGSGRYSLSKMYPVKSKAELRRLLKMSDEELPELARGALPNDPAAVALLRQTAAAAHVARYAKDAKRKARIKAARMGGGPA